MRFLLLFSLLFLGGCDFLADMAPPWIDGRPELQVYMAPAADVILVGPAPLTVGIIATAAPKSETEEPFELCVDFGDETSACDGGLFLHTYRAPGNFTVSAQACYLKPFRGDKVCYGNAQLTALVLPAGGDEFCTRCAGSNYAFDAVMVANGEMKYRQVGLVNIAIDVKLPLSSLYVELDWGSLLRLRTDVQPMSKINVPVGKEHFPFEVEATATGRGLIRITVHGSLPDGEAYTEVLEQEITVSL